MNQQAIEQELAAHRERIDGIEQCLAQIAQNMTQFSSGMIAVQAKLDANAEQLSANAEQIAANTAGLVELRVILADYLSSRNQQ